MNASRLKHFIVALAIVSMLGVGSAWAGDRSHRGYPGNGHGIYQHHRPEYGHGPYKGPRHTYRKHVPPGYGPHYYGRPHYYGPHHRPHQHYSGWTYRRPYRPAPPAHHYYSAPSAYGFAASMYDSGYSLHFGITERW